MRIAIVDDEKDIIADIRNNIERCCKEKNINVKITAFFDGEELLKGYNKQYDVIFLDIEMNHVNGMEAAYAIRKVDTETVIVFITHMMQYAIEGYRVSALDFLLKPVSPYQFDLIFRKILRIVKSTVSEKKMILNIKGKRKIFAIKNLLYVDVQGHYLTWHLNSGENIKVKGVLSEAEDKVRGLGFTKCNRYCLVNLKYVSEVGKENLILRNGEEIALSRGKSKMVLLEIARYVGGDL